MRCRICGAKLAKENADICLNCYKSYQEEEDLKKDVEEKLVVKRKYKISYTILKYAEVVFIFLLATLGFITYGNVIEAIWCILIFVLLMVLLLAINKRIAQNTKAVFYNKKVVYTSKNILFHTEKTVKYSDLTDITFFQSWRQRKKGFGDICVYAKGTVPGATLLNGFQIKDVENIDEVMEAIKNTIGMK